MMTLVSCSIQEESFKLSVQQHYDRISEKSNQQSPDMNEQEHQLTVIEMESVVLLDNAFVYGQNHCFKQSKKCKNQEQSKSSHIMPTNAIVYPWTVMIISINTHIAEIAVVALRGLVRSTLRTERRRQVFERQRLFLFRSEKKRDVKDNVKSIEQSCRYHIRQRKLDDYVGWDGRSNKENNKSYYKHKTWILLSINCFLVAQYFEFVEERSFLIQNSGQFAIVPFPCNLVCSSALIVNQRPISSFQQQSFHYLILALFDCCHERCLEIFVYMVDIYFVQSHQQPNHFDTSFRSSNIQRCLTIFILLVKIKIFAIQVEQRRDLVILSTHMDQVLSCIALVKKIPSKLLKIFDHIHITIKTRVVDRQITFVISLVYPCAQIQFELFYSVESC